MKLTDVLVSNIISSSWYSLSVKQLVSEKMKSNHCLLYMDPYDNFLLQDFSRYQACSYINISCNKIHGNMRSNEHQLYKIMAGIHNDADILSFVRDNELLDDVYGNLLFIGSLLKPVQSMYDGKMCKLS